MRKTAAKRQVATGAEALDFLTKLATTPQMLGAFLRDADALMKKENIDEQTRASLASGDPLRVHRSISESAAAENEAAERSMAKAREVMDIVSSDPAVAQWLQGYYYQSLMTWLAAGGGAGQAAGGVTVPGQWQASKGPTDSADA